MQFTDNDLRTLGKGMWAKEWQSVTGLKVLEDTEQHLVNPVILSDLVFGQDEEDEQDDAIDYTWLVVSMLELDVC